MTIIKKDKRIRAIKKGVIFLITVGLVIGAEKFFGEIVATATTVLAGVFHVSDIADTILG